jgi:hypothetical protein
MMPDHGRFRTERRKNNNNNNFEVNASKTSLTGNWTTDTKVLQKLGLRLRKQELGVCWIRK